MKRRDVTPVPSPAFAALVRDDFGGLVVRHFPTGEAANAAAQTSGRDLVMPDACALRGADRKAGALGSPADLAQRLGGVPSAKTISRLCKRGDLPCRNDGAGTLPRYRLPIRAIVASIMQGGLSATIARQRAGFFGQV